MQVFINKDKDDIREDDDTECLSNFKRGSRVLITGPPNFGKSNIVKNLIINQAPPFKYIQIFVADKNTKEYEFGEKISTIDEIMDYTKLNKDEKLLIVFEDVEFHSMKKKELEYIDKLCRFGCTHLGVSVIISCQNYFGCPISLRRKIDIFYLLKMDKQTSELISRTIPLNKTQFRTLCDMVFINRFDSMCIDSTHSTSTFRRNLNENISIGDINKKIEENELHRLRTIAAAKSDKITNI